MTYFEKEHGFFDTVIDAWNSGIEWHKNNQWISVDDRLPEDRENILIRTEENNYYMVFICGGSIFASFSEYELYDYKFTHWMGIPKIPEAREIV